MGLAMSAEPNNITIELIHGGSVHVETTPTELGQKIYDAKRKESDYVDLTRVHAFDSRHSHGFQTIRIYWRHIVGVYPLTSHSDPPHQYLRASAFG